jgi:hypothetical protein
VGLVRHSIVIVCLFVASLVAAAPCRHVAFGSAPWFPGGEFTVPDDGGITSLAAADFNGDGNADLVVASGGDVFRRYSRLTIFFNDGRGEFSNGIVILKDVFVRDVKILDFDGDGAPDLLVTEDDTGKLSVLVNQGNTFAEAWRDEERGEEPTIGDFNGDGYVDVARRVGSELVVLAGGRGTFTKFRFSEPAGASGPITAGDLDGDGLDDLIESLPEAHQLMVRRGNLQNFLGTPSPTPAFREKPYFLFVGDFDGNGHPDIVSEPLDVPILEVLHDAGVSSTGPVFQSYSGYSYQMIAGDFTGDGIPDLVSNVPFGRIVTGVLGSNPTFQPLKPSYFALPLHTLSPMVAADFNNDGALDLAVSSEQDVAILLNHGGAHFVAPPQIAATGVRAVVDLNHDGIRDLITDTNPIVWFGNADGTYTAGTAARPKGAFNDETLVEVADLNADGHDDLVVVAHNPFGTTNGQLWIMLGDGSGSFVTHDLGFFGHRPTSLVVTDIDRDGKLDIVVGSDIPLSGMPVTIAYGRGDGTFEPSVDITVPGGGTQMSVGDINGDGLPDIMAGDGYGRTVLINLGHRQFRSTWSQEPFEGPMRLTDVNGDGKWDLIEAVSRSLPTRVEVRVRLSRGDGTFAAAVVTQVPIYDADSMLIADLNGDGHPDVVIDDASSTASTNTFSVLLGNGTAAFDPPRLWPSNGRLTIVDLNGDGLLDIMNGDSVRMSSCTDAPHRRAVTH